MARPYIIAVDGLDGTGKSTYAKMLKEILSDQYSGDVFLQHFPVYENKTGKEIKEFLLHHADADDEEKRLQMIDLQIKNRKEWWEEFIPTLKDMTYRPILVADRYMASNDIYNAILCNKWEDEVAKIHMIEYNNPQPSPDLQIFVFCDPRLQKRRLKGKKRDKYEAWSYQKRLNHKLPKYIKLYTQKYQNTVCIPTHCLDVSYVSGEHKLMNYSDTTVTQLITEYKMFHVLNQVVYAAMEKDGIHLNIPVNDKCVEQMEWFIAKELEVYEGLVEYE